MNAILFDIMERAIKHEKECTCPAHEFGRKMTEAEFTALRIILGTSEGFSMMMGIFTAVIAEVDQMEERLKVAVADHQDNPLF
jgi:hypothetical protein